MQKNEKALEKKLKLSMEKGNEADAAIAFAELLKCFPDNLFVNHCSIKNLYAQKKYEDSLLACQKLSERIPNDLLSLKVTVLSAIELKKYDTAQNAIVILLKEDNTNIEYLLLDAEIKISRGYYDLALNVYMRIAELSPTFFHKKTEKRINYVETQHIQNAKNLCKRKAYEMISKCKGISHRLDLAIDDFFGLKAVERKEKKQQPSFFYMPNLSAKAFYEKTDIVGVEDLVRAIHHNVDKLHQIITTETSNSYLNVIPTKTNSVEWNKLMELWDSIHLIQGGNVLPPLIKSNELFNIFQNSCLAYCPPHAPEVFLSTLQPNTVIPPHYGLSNIKLTVHIPILVDEKASITVGTETKNWVNSDCLIFDDSFLHTAENHSEKARTVLIFDVWHPDLLKEEKEAIQNFMLTYEKWSNEYKAILN